jgi:hypothetical protein
MPREQCKRRSLRRLDGTSAEHPDPAHFLNDDWSFLLPSKRCLPRRPML